MPRRRRFGRAFWRRGLSSADHDPEDASRTAFVRCPQERRPRPWVCTRKCGQRIVRVRRERGVEGSPELASDRTGRPGVAHDQQLRHNRRLAELCPAVPGRQRGRLLSGPPDELLETTKFGLDLRGHEHPAPGVEKPSVDPTSRRTAHHDLWESAPTRVQQGEQCLEDSRLVPIANCGSRVRIEAHREIGTERGREPCVRLERRVPGSLLNAAQEAGVDAGTPRQLGGPDARIVAQACNVNPQPAMKLVRGSSGPTPEAVGIHAGSRPPRTQRTITGRPARDQPRRLRLCPAANFS